MNICCLSIKYSKPDIFSELVAFGLECEKEGHSISYIFSQHCNWLVKEFTRKIRVKYLGESADTKSMIIDHLKFNTTEKNKIKNIFRKKNFDILFFGNMHPSNKLIAKIAIQAGCSEIWWWLHEPYRKSKKNYGFWRKYYYVLAELLQVPFLKIVGRVIVSSLEAKSTFLKRYPWYTGKVVHCPLILLDYYKYCKSSNPKYVSFVGTAAKSKGVDKFFKLVEYAATKKPTLNFQIITSSNLSKFVTNLSSTAKARLKIVSGDHLSDIQIGNAIRNSLTVITPYRQTMQSGVVPASFMQGVPVISTDVGSMSEYVHHSKTGLLLPINASMDEWLNSIKIIKENRNIIGKNCREFYQKNHSPKNWKNLFPQLIDIQS